MWALAAAMLSTLNNPTNANEIFIEAFGNSIEMSLIQKNGQDNLINLYFNGENNYADIVQNGNNNSIGMALTGPSPTSAIIYQNGDNHGLAINNWCNNPSNDGFCHIYMNKY